MSQLKEFQKLQVLELQQPLANAYVFTIKASVLTQLSFSMAAHSLNGKMSGVQRKLKADRIKQIALFSQSTKATFPGTVILSANFHETGMFADDERIRWRIEESNHLLIPTEQKLASIIDGQHRVEGIVEAMKMESFRDFDIACCVYIDLPFPEQAEIFTSINFNQRKVDKSIAYELFGYDVDENKKSSWSPDTLAIYFARILNNDKDSPFKNRIFSGLAGNQKNTDWFVSTACIVEAISGLITTNATKDRYYMNQSAFFSKGRKRLTDLRVKSPLRDYYIEGRDKDIFDIVLAYLRSIEKLGWFGDANFVTTKTIGVMAIFDVLKEILNESLDIDKMLSRVESLNELKLEKLEKNSYSFSGIGRGQLKKIIMEYI